MPGVLLAHSLVCKMKKAHKQSHRRFARYVPAFPARMVLTVSFVLSLVSRACCHHHLQDHHPTGLISASGYQDHTTSPSAYTSARLAQISVHRIPRPTFCDDRETPLMRARDARKNAGDLPDVASKNACDRLARRANHLVIPEAA
jgi:hypothetical protein